MKHDDFQGAKHLRVNEFIIKQHDFVRAWARVFGDTLNPKQSSFLHKSKYAKSKTCPQDSEDELDDFRGSQEQWRKKLKICSSPNNTGQFEQAPAVSMSDTPDPKKKVKTKLKRKTSAFPNYLKTAFKNVFNRRRVAECAKKAAKNWHELSQEEKRTYANNNKNKNHITKLSKQRTNKQVLQNDIKRRLTIKEIRTNGLRRGFINIKNNFSLNALIQGLATTLVGEMGRIDEGCNAPLLLVHLIRTICEIKKLQECTAVLSAVCSLPTP